MRVAAGDILRADSSVNIFVKRIFINFEPKCDGAKLHNVTALALTKLDCLSQQKTLTICTHYKIGGKLVETFPITPELLVAEPVHMELPGRDEDIHEIRDFEELPKTAHENVETIEKLVTVPVDYISVGPEHEALIVRKTR